VEREHPQVAIIDPSTPHLGVGEVPGVDGEQGDEAQVEESLDGAPEVVGGEVDGEIEVGGQSGVPVKDRGHPTDDDAAHLRPGERDNHGLEQRHRPTLPRRNLGTAGPTRSGDPRQVQGRHRGCW